MRIIGDVHGKFSQYQELLNCPASIQIGDLGFNPPEFPAAHKHFRGNHDSYNLKHPNDLGDFGVHEGLFFVRGAHSIDRAGRIEGFDWFANEELAYGEMVAAMSLYQQTKPEIVLSHDGPQSIVEMLWGYERNATRIFLDQLLEIWQPTLWIFGHHHQSRSVEYGRTRFVCLAELETLEL